MLYVLFLSIILPIQILSEQNISNERINITRKENITTTTDSLLEIVYWEIKPFIFINEDGQLDGIIPKILEEAEYYCTNKSKLANFVLRVESRQKFYDLIRSNVEYGKGTFSNVSEEKVFWAPIMARKNKNSKNIEKKVGVKSFQLMKSEKIAVIVPRHYISLPQKMFRGILSCKQIFVLAFLLAALASMSVWFIEHFHESQHFHDSFIKGVGTAMWWSLVSMTTVGYGDIVLKSALARFVAVVWLFIGLMIACLMTATMTDVVSSIDVNIHGKVVSVLENSFDEKVASADYGAKVVTGSSYKEVIELVRNNTVYAAMINADVAAWYQDDINNDHYDTPLRVVETLPANLYINCYVPLKISDELKDIFRCMYHGADEVYKSSIESFHRYCYKEVLYIGPMSEFFHHNKFVQILTYTVLSLFLVGIIYEVLFVIMRKDTPKNRLRCNTLLATEMQSDT